MERFRGGDNMGIFKKTWHWLFPKTNEGLIKEYSNIKGNEEKALKAQEIYNKVTREREGTKIKGGVNTRPTTPRTLHLLHKIPQEILKRKLMNILDNNRLEEILMIIS